MPGHSEQPASGRARSAIVLGVGHPRGLAVVRSLGRIGVSVVAVDHRRDARGMYSKYLRERIFVDESPAQALTALEALDRHYGAVLIATNDHYVMLVAQNYERLSRAFVVTTPPWTVVRRLMDKRECYTLAGSLGLGLPRFFAPTSAAELD